MKATLTLVTGVELELDADLGELTTALERQEPARVIVHADGSRDIINMRTVALISLAAPEDTRTVAELKADLEAAGVEFDSKAHKADLQALAQENGL